MNLGEFRALFLGRLNRDDCDTALADGFITEGITRIQREVRAPIMEREFSTVVGLGGVASFTVPSNYIEGFEVLVDDVPMNRLSYRQFLREQNSAPRVYARYGSSIFVNGAVPEGATLRLLYYGAFDPLPDAAATNTLLTTSPDLALYAALSAAGDHFQHEKTAEWEGRYVANRDAVQLQAIEDEMRGGPQMVAPMYSDPGI
jgi:hypothetical protein